MVASISPKAQLALLAALFGLVLIAVYAFVAHLTDPEATDGCLSEHDLCRSAAAGWLDVADCGIALYHCRILGVHAESAAQ